MAGALRARAGALRADVLRAEALREGDLREEALRAGAGLSTVATSKSVLATVAGFHPELMTEPLEETDAGSISMLALQQGRMDSLAERKTALAIGPGISRHPETAEFVRGVVKKFLRWT